MDVWVELWLDGWMDGWSYYLVFLQPCLQAAVLSTQTEIKVEVFKDTLLPDTPLIFFVHTPPLLHTHTRLPLHFLPLLLPYPNFTHLYHLISLSSVSVFVPPPSSPPAFPPFFLHRWLHFLSLTSSWEVAQKSL